MQMIQKLLLIIIKKLIKYLDGYHLCKNPVRVKKNGADRA
jgi:hypothetical protein